MAINKKLIHFKNKLNFDTEVANGNILDTSIVFILDTKEIWTHGTYYATPSGSTISAEEIENIITSSETIQAAIEQIAGEVVTESNKQDQISDLDTIRQGALLGSTAIQPGTGDGTKYLSDDGSYKEITATSSGIPIIEFNASSIELEPNKFYKLTEVQTSLSITLATPSNSTIVNEYLIEFPCQDTTITLPNNLSWNNDVLPTFENGHTYHISIINNLAAVLSFTTPN